MVTYAPLIFGAGMIGIAYTMSAGGAMSYVKPKSKAITPASCRSHTATA